MNCFKARKRKISESADKFSFFCYLHRICFDNRGEVGAVKPFLPGEDAVDKSGGSIPEDSQNFVTNPTDDSYSPKLPSATEQPAQDDSDESDEYTKALKEIAEKSQPPVTEEAKPAAKESQEAKKPEAAPDTDVNVQLADLTAKLAYQQQVAEFYMNQFNKIAGAGGIDGSLPQAAMQGQQSMQSRDQNQQQQPGVVDATKPLPTPDALPPNVLPPGEWESQDDEAAYLDHRFTGIRSDFENFYQSSLRPVLDHHHQVIEEFKPMMAIIEQVMETVPQYAEAKKKLDDAKARVERELFEFSPDGKPIGKKNPALLQFLRAQKNPYKAMLDYVAMLDASKNTKQGVVKATKAALEKAIAKPRGATMPPSTGTNTSGSAPAQPSQTSKDQRAKDEYLKSRGLI